MNSVMGLSRWTVPDIDIKGSLSEIEENFPQTMEIKSDRRKAAMHDFPGPTPRNKNYRPPNVISPEGLTHGAVEII